MQEEYDFSRGVRGQFYRHDAVRTVPTANSTFGFDNFVALFKPLDPQYQDLTKLVDKYVGFSVQRNYPESKFFSPASRIDGQPDTVALIHVLSDNDVSSSVGDQLPLIARVSKYSKYLATHFDYNFDDVESPTELSLSMSKSGRQPIDSVFEYEYFVDLSSHTLRRKNGTPILGSELLDEIFNEHVASLNTLHPTRLLSKSKLLVGSAARIIEATCKILLTKFLGRELIEDKDLRFMWYGYTPENVRKLPTDSIKLFEYLVPKSVAVVFCVAVVLFFSLFHLTGLTSPYLKKIVSTPLLALTHVIFLLWLLNDVTPELLRRILNRAIVMRTKHRARK